MKYRVLLEQDEDGLFMAEVPALPGCISQGETRAKAIANIRKLPWYDGTLTPHRR